MAPGPAASASAEPLMPEKNVIVRMFVCPRPPRKRPTNCDAKRSSTSDSAPPVISSAVRMKNGTAISAKTSMPVNRYFGSAISGRWPDDHRGERRAAQRECDRHAEREQHDAADEQDVARSQLRRVGVELAVGEERAGART